MQRLESAWIACGRDDQDLWFRISRSRLRRHWSRLAVVLAVGFGLVMHPHALNGSIRVVLGEPVTIGKMSLTANSWRCPQSNPSQCEALLTATNRGAVALRPAVTDFALIGDNGSMVGTAESTTLVGAVAPSETVNFSIVFRSVFVTPQVLRFTDLASNRTITVILQLRRSVFPDS